MSHIATVQVEIKDLAALSAACKLLGAEFVENQTQYRVFQGNVKCAHAIRLSGAQYEIGVVKTKTGFSLSYDFWNQNKMVQTFGQNCERLVQEYGVQKATLEAKRKGYTVRRAMLPNGSVQLKIGGVR